ncbi:MAG: fused MFS/spermidine synthase, partial [Albidovulum sp.]
LGGVFNSIRAPAVFVTLAEGGITTLLATTLILSSEMRLTLPLVRKGIAFGVGTAAVLVLAAQPFAVESWLALKLIMFALAATVAILLRRTVPAAALAAGLVVVTGTYVIPTGDIFRDRSFFGTHWVADVDGLRQYANGTTLHGAERVADYAKPRPEPLFYYHRNAPMAQVMTSGIGRSAKNVGIVGLGVGSLACYKQPGQDWQFYEIDAVVDKIARNPAYFTFMSACAGSAPTHLGDARMVLARQEGLKYDILVIDAYGSDSVPVHLTTQEAMQLYLDRLAPDGVLLYHITNRYYAIERPLSRSAAALGLEARIQNYPGNAEIDPGDSGSRVVMLARNAGALGALADDRRWEALIPDGGRIWTDDYANLLSVLQ